MRMMRDGLANRPCRAWREIKRLFGFGMKLTAVLYRPFLLLLLVAAAYSNTLHVPFLLDDIVFIVESEPIRTLSLAFWSQGWSGPNWIDFRPLADLTFRLNYRISGLEVWSYHLLNIGIHGANAVLLYTVLQQILATRLSVPWSQRAAFASAAVWVVHPININAVTYISQRFESLAALFALAALAAFLHSRVGGGRSAQWWCLFFVLASFGSKLANLALPILIVLLDRFVLPRSTQDRLSRRIFYPLLVATWVLAAVLFAARGDWTRSTGDGGVLFTPDNLRMQAVVVLYYCGKLLWPVGLVFEEGKWSLPPAHLWIPAVAVLVVPLLWSVVAVFRRNLAAFAVVAFFLLLAPSSSFIVVSAYDAATYRMYLPGACLIALVFGSLAWALSRREGRLARTLFVPGTLVLVLILGITTWRRNQVYNSPTDLWADNTAKRPMHAGSYVGWSEALMNEGHLVQAEETLFRARRMFPDNARLLNLSGMVAFEDGRVQAAEAYWNRARVLAPDNHVVLNNLAIFAARRGEWPEAKALFSEVLNLRPTDVIALGNAAQVCLQLGERGEADRLVRRGLEVDPGDELLLRLQAKLNEVTPIGP